MNTPRFLFRDAQLSDLPAVHQIYAHYVEHSDATFDLKAPALSELEAKFRSLQASGYVFRILDIEGNTAGYAHIGPFNSKAGYAASAENSIYLHPDCRGHGLGSQLLQDLIEECERRGRWQQMVALIGGSAPQASLAMHRKAGFSDAGHLKRVGYKFGRWLDVFFLQRQLQDRHPSKEEVCLEHPGQRAQTAQR